MAGFEADHGYDLDDRSGTQTKLLYIDIHNHLLRREILAGCVAVRYIRSGLTKALSNAAFEESRKQLGLIDISDRIAEKRRTEEAEEELENESLERLLNLDLEI